MGDLVEFKGKQFPALVWQGQKVVTFKFIDWAHEFETPKANPNFYRNKHRFSENHDYWLITPKTLKLHNVVLEIPVPNRGLILLNERGYLKLVKIFEDDKSWAIYEMLLEVYFRAGDLVKAYRELEKRLETEIDARLELEKRMRFMERLFLNYPYLRRREFRHDDKKLALQALDRLGNRCLIDKNTILVENGKLVKIQLPIYGKLEWRTLLHYDHFNNNRYDNRRQNIFPICHWCNLEKEKDHSMSTKYIHEWETFQRMLCEVAKQDYQIPLCKEWFATI